VSAQICFLLDEGDGFALLAKLHCGVSACCASAENGDVAGYDGDVGRGDGPDRRSQGEEAGEPHGKDRDDCVRLVGVRAARRTWTDTTLFMSMTILELKLRTIFRRFVESTVGTGFLEY
jgi:hypothetical protein